MGTRVPKWGSMWEQWKCEDGARILREFAILFWKMCFGWMDGWMPTSVRGRARAETLCTKQMSGLNRSPLPYLPSRVDWTAGAVWSVTHCGVGQCSKCFHFLSSPSSLSHPRVIFLSSPALSFYVVHTIDTASHLFTHCTLISLPVGLFSTC